jgi:hypothetical protein
MDNDNGFEIVEKSDIIKLSLNQSITIKENSETIKMLTTIIQSKLM